MTYDPHQLAMIARRLAQDFVLTRYPGEAEYFVFIWDQLGALDASGRGRSGEAPVKLDPDRFGLSFADDAQTRLAAPFAILTVSAVLCELNARGFAPELVEIQVAIKKSAGCFGADIKLSNELAEELGPNLFDVFRQADRAQLDSIVEDDHRVIVEWWDVETRPSEADPIPHHDILDYSAVQTKFVAAKDRYQLFVDETKLLLWVGQRNRWNLLQRQHLRFLYLVLSAFRHSRRIPYESIVRVVFDDHRMDLDMYRGRIRTVKSELNTKLDHVLGPYVDAQRKQDLYSIQGQMPYCWIRSQSISALLR